MDNNIKKWVYLVLLALVWGSSFILMKKALLGVTPIQLGALRMIFTSIFLVLIAPKTFRKVKKHHWKYILYTALSGTFFPVFLFAYAMLNIDSSIVSILNSFTPFNTLIIGAIFFGFAFKRIQLFGIVIGLIGTLILIVKGAEMNPNQNYAFAILVVIASVGYALNGNIVKRYLSDLDALSITTGNFILLFAPALIVLAATGFFNSFQGSDVEWKALGYIGILSVVGTGIAKTIYNELVHISSPVFSSSVTYLIPIVAVFWGIFDGERLSVIQVIAGGIILLGVYLVNMKRPKLLNMRTKKGA